MKTAYLLFGLAGAACAPTPPTPQYPLCDPAGSPACGNIGQVGRADRPAYDPLQARPRPAARESAVTFATAVTDTTTHVVPAITRVLVGASREVQRVTPFSRPLVDHREDVVCGNVMGKGGKRPACRDSDGRVVADPDRANPDADGADGTLIATP